MFGESQKDDVFYDAFREQSRSALDAATKFSDLLEDASRTAELAPAIHEDKQRGDTIFRKTVHQLHSIWITPIDRHQIHEMVVGLDGVVKLIDSTVSRMQAFRITDPRAEACELARNMSDACKRVHAATQLLPKLSKENAEEVMRMAAEIHEIEGHSDEIHRRALATLFDGRTEALEVMKWRDVLDNIADATRMCRDVASLFEAIILENA